MALRDLQELFGHGFLMKIREKPTRHQLPGKHFMAMSHGVGVGKLPQTVRLAGSKLAKRFSRDAWRTARDRKNIEDQRGREVRAKRHRIEAMKKPKLVRL